MYIFLKPLSVISMCYIYPRCSCPNQKRWKVGDVIKNKKEVSISYELKAWRALEWILRQKYNLDDKKNPQILFVVSTKKDGCVIEQNLIKGILLHFQRTLVMQWILSGGKRFCQSEFHQSCKHPILLGFSSLFMSLCSSVSSGPYSACCFLAASPLGA